MKGLTQAYERQLREELNSLLAKTAPGEASSKDAGRALLLAVMGHDAEMRDLYERVRRLARSRAGYLRERMEEDNLVSAIRQRLRFPVVAGLLPEGMAV